MANEGHWRETHVNAYQKELLPCICAKRPALTPPSAHTKPHLWVLLLTLLKSSGTEMKCLSGSGPTLHLCLWWGEVEWSKTVGSWLKICSRARTGKEIKQNKTCSFCSTINNSTTKRKPRHRLNQEIARPLQFHFVKE